MATGMSTLEANEALDAWLATFGYVQLHTAEPGATGVTAVATNNTRKAVTWGSAASGLKSNTNLLEWTSVPANEDYTHISFWTASTSGTFGGSGTIVANAVTTGDTFQIAAGDLDVTVTTIAS